MMTKSELEGIRELQYQIDTIKRDITRLNERSVISSPQASEIHSSGIADTVAARGNRLADLEHELAELIVQRDERLAYINSINDIVLRTIVRCYCVYGFRWKKIAQKVGGGNTEDSVRKLYERFSP